MLADDVHARAGESKVIAVGAVLCALVTFRALAHTTRGEDDDQVRARPNDVR